MKHFKMQKSIRSNLYRKILEENLFAPNGTKDGAIAAYEKKWNHNSATNFVTYYIKGNATQEWNNAIKKTAISEKFFARQYNKRENEPSAEESKKHQKKKESKIDLLKKFQFVEWNAIILAAAQMDETHKKEKLAEMMDMLTVIGDKLKGDTLKSLGISTITVETRMSMDDQLVEKIFKSRKWYPMRTNLDQNRTAVHGAMCNFEARAWQLLEQGTKAKNAAQTKNIEKKEKEQKKLFQSAHQYFGAAAGLASDSESVGIPKDIVRMRAEQHMNYMGNDPSLSNMSKPSREAYSLNSGVVFSTYVNELMEKLVKTIKRMISEAQASHGISPDEVKPLTTQAVEWPLSSEASATI